MEEHTIHVLSCFNVKSIKLCIGQSNIKGILDLSKFTKLLSLKCHKNKITKILNLP